VPIVGENNIVIRLAWRSFQAAVEVFGILKRDALWSAENVIRY
jgi:hypothetical protein